MIADLYLAVLLLAMAAGQTASFPRFVDALGAYGINTPIVTVTAAGLIAGETLSGIGLILGDGEVHTAAAALALTVATGWTALAAVALARRRHVPNCGCFGAYATQRLRPTVLAQDAAFLALAIWVLLT